MRFPGAMHFGKQENCNAKKKHVATFCPYFGYPVFAFYAQKFVFAKTTESWFYILYENSTPLLFQVVLLEEDMDRKAISLKEMEAKLQQTEKDYENYKVRAQSVLKHAREHDAATAEKSQEILSLERHVQSLNEKISDMRLENVL